MASPTCSCATTLSEACSNLRYDSLAQQLVGLSKTLGVLALLYVACNARASWYCIFPDGRPVDSLPTSADADGYLRGRMSSTCASRGLSRWSWARPLALLFARSTSHKMAS